MLSNKQLLAVIGLLIVGAVLILAVIAAIVVAVILLVNKNKNAVSNEKSYKAIIYGYQKSEHLYVNGSPVVNTKVRYFDEDGVKREALLKTRFVEGSADYPIGGVIDIKVKKNSVSWDKSSVRYDSIDREEELMENKPVNLSELKMKPVICKKCGAGYDAAEGYVSKCPYCGCAMDN